MATKGTKVPHIPDQSGIVMPVVVSVNPTFSTSLSLYLSDLIYIRASYRIYLYRIYFVCTSCSLVSLSYPLYLFIPFCTSLSLPPSLVLFHVFMYLLISPPLCLIPLPFLRLSCSPPLRLNDLSLFLSLFLSPPLSYYFLSYLTVSLSLCLASLFLFSPLSRSSLCS